MQGQGIDVCRLQLVSALILQRFVHALKLGKTYTTKRKYSYCSLHFVLNLRLHFTFSETNVYSFEYQGIGKLV
jgi:hypothetical protein